MCTLNDRTTSDISISSDRPHIFLDDIAYFSSNQPHTGCHVFPSTVCRSEHFLMPLYHYWTNLLKEKPRFHRKQWEFVFICHVLKERGYLRSGSRGLGFGVGKEPLADLFSSLGCQVLATDLPEEEAVGSGWIESSQHASNIEALYRGISDRPNFLHNVSFRSVNMNNIPSDLRQFDFAYSSCSIEHVGSLELSKRFLLNVLDTLRPGGLSVHTTEYNITSNIHTIHEGSTILWRRQDFESLAAELRALGHFVEPLDFYTGSGLADNYVDVPPYSASEPHLRLTVGAFASTSFGLVVRKAE